MLLPRLYKDLLITLRHEIRYDDKQWKATGCMCLMIKRLHRSKIISYEDHLLLFDYLQKQKPKASSMDKDWFKHGDKQARIYWLDRQIQILNTKENDQETIY